MKKHRNSQKRIIFEDACYFVTAKTFNNFPYFREKIFCDLFVENLKLCKKLKGFLLFGWVVIYDHIHLLFQPNDEFDISKVMQFLKRNISRCINFIMGFNEHDEQTYPILEGDNDHCRLRRLLDIQQFIKTKLGLKIRFEIKYLNQNPYPKFRWQKSFIDHYERNDSDFNYHMEYIVWNPVKHDLPSDWPYIFTNPDFEELVDEF